MLVVVDLGQPARFGQDPEIVDISRDEKVGVVVMQKKTGTDLFHDEEEQPKPGDGIQQGRFQH